MKKDVVDQYLLVGWYRTVPSGFARMSMDTDYVRDSHSLYRKKDLGS